FSSSDASIDLSLSLVADHYENPRNVWSLDKTSKSAGTGLEGASGYGDGKTVDTRCETFGCGSAIAFSLLTTEWVKGKMVEEAQTIKNTDIAKDLCLPPVKMPCSMLAEDAIKATLADYKLKQEPTEGEVKKKWACREACSRSHQLSAHLPSNHLDVQKLLTLQ
uniref:NIF system FeS cluster assembly NifU N-terminal domain-containing protein n=1 Tax=Equus asinus asinus TaxID=83772 RepID=A0A8C4PGQ6_EQUAS